MARRSQVIWTFAITSLALFMVTLDNLVVTTALPVIRHDLHANLQQLEWTINAYTLTFAVLLLTGAALGDRFGRRRIFSIGLAIFTLGSAASALAQSPTMLIVARAVQGAGAAMVTPLTLTILSAAVPANRRGVALGAWGGIGGLAVAVGPIVGGAIVQGISWHWIFWVNVPIGLLLAPLARIRLSETRGADNHLDLGGLVIASAGLFAIVWGLVRANQQGWTSPEILGTLAGGLALMVVFVHLRAPLARADAARSATSTTGRSAAPTLASLFMFFGMFGSVFLLAQFFQTVQGLSPLDAGLRILPWTAMPIIVAPTAGALSDRINGRTLDGDRARAPGHRADLDRPCGDPDRAVLGIHRARSSSAASAWACSSHRWRMSCSARWARVRRARHPGRTTPFASSAASSGSPCWRRSSPTGAGTPPGATFVAGLTPAVTVGGVVVAVGAVAAAFIPARRRAASAEAATRIEEAAAA